MTLIIANTRLVSTKNSYRREANSNLKELKDIMKRLTIQDTNYVDKVLTDTRRGSGTVWAPQPKQKKLRRSSCNYNHKKANIKAIVVIHDSTQIVEVTTLE